MVLSASLSRRNARNSEETTIGVEMLVSYPRVEITLLKFDVRANCIVLCWLKGVLFAKEIEMLL